MWRPVFAISVACFAVSVLQADDLPLRIPKIPEWKLMKAVNPEYPLAALRAHIQGTVCFDVIIGKDGHVERLRLINGHRMLVAAARQAIQQWVYRPTLEAGKPVRVRTTIRIPFQLDEFGRPEKQFGSNHNQPAEL